jgi:NADH-quinone oxidoreductase subunit J
MPSFLFFPFAMVTLGAALFTITRRNPLTAAWSLVISFIALAGLYAMLSAPLMAILQILVYAGAIMALVVFVIMLLNVREEDLPAEPNMPMHVTIALVVVTPLLLILGQGINKFQDMPSNPNLPASFGGIKAVGMELFNRFGFPFELVSLLLTVAVVGVVVLAKRRI